MHALLSLLLLVSAAGCSKRVPSYTSSGKEVLMVQKNVELYRKKPHIWPAKGWVAATENELIFVPSPYYGGLYINGRDSTFIQLRDIVGLEEKRWMLMFPYRLEVTTSDSSVYSFVTVRRSELIRKINELKLEE
ncbi:hypothetical protein PKOR_07010 [Pontibacter korlensis]|uniref:Uncharacterized protein n=1 Tax=Pontibacter korlensis TaxID=400092 RepID=A0A0E3ZEE2_9BACT|nr:hypothetical protein PKOR_07010 [Pontibacter korlensis]